MVVRRVGDLRHRQRSDRAVNHGDPAARSVRHRRRETRGIRFPARMTPRIPANQSGSPSGPKTAAEFSTRRRFHSRSGTFGDSRPGALLGPGFQLWDTSLFKNIKFGERASFATPAGDVQHLQSRQSLPDLQQRRYRQLRLWLPGLRIVTDYHIPRELQIGGKFTF